MVILRSQRQRKKSRSLQDRQETASPRSSPGWPSYMDWDNVADHLLEQHLDEDTISNLVFEGMGFAYQPV